MHAKTNLTAYLRGLPVVELAVFVCLCAVSTPHVHGQTPFIEGVRLYEAGKSSAALNAFREAIAANPRSPLAYYYAARIRLENEQYEYARINLAKALADSADFPDAYALMAVTLLKQDDTEGAQAAWRRFVAAVGAVGGEDQSAVSSIMYPEDYRRKLAEEARQSEAADSLADGSLDLSLGSHEDRF